MTGIAELNLKGLKTADYLRAESRLSSEEKSGLATYLASALDPNRLSAEDFANAEAILRLIVWNSDAHVVEVLARTAANNPNTPKSIAWALANDDEAAAAHILEASSALSDADLVAIAQNSESPAKLGAIARRSAVSEEVARSLVQHGDEQTVKTLLANPNAVIPGDAAERMRDRFADNVQIRDAMAGRKLAVERAPLPGFPDLRTEEELAKRMAQLIAQKSLNEFLLIGELCLGNFEFFARALAALAQAPGDEVWTAIVASPAEQLPGLWEKAALPPEWLPLARAAVMALIQIDAGTSKADRKIFCRNVVDRTLAVLKADKVTLTDAQRRFLTRQGGR